ncbi:MAG: CapA family protein [Eubacteriales bacterium]|nr:CapA family protein [Eubacteriales bacterium]
MKRFAALVLLALWVFLACGAAEESDKGEPQRLVITAVGDCTLGGDAQKGGSNEKFFQKFVDKYGYEYFLKNVKSIFENDDITIVNLEGPLTSEKKHRSGRFIFRGAPDHVNILTCASVEVCNVANNHALDFLEAGFQETLKTLDEAGIGASGYDVEYYMDIKGITVGFVGYSYRENKADQMIAGAKKARKKCDLLIVSVHGGEENNYKMTSFMRTTTKKLVDVGADLVLCHHPHVYGPILTYNGKYIVGSLGNFCFGGNYIPKDKDTQIFQQTFLIYPDGTIEDGGINLIPCSVSSEKAHNNFQPTPLEGKEAEKLFNKFMKLSNLKVTDLNWMPGSYLELAGLLPTEEAE